MHMTVAQMDPRRYRTREDLNSYRPVHVVWELTLACDLKCRHCGSRAGAVRRHELSTDECLALIEQLAELRTREITLIGGEAYLRKDWLTIIRAIRAAGIDCTLQTGGRNLTPQRVEDAVKAGLQAAGVSIDGLQSVHDEVRGVEGSFESAVDALHAISSAGITASVNTQITSRVVSELPHLLDVIAENGAKHWQVQLTVAMGNAVDHPELLLQPYDLLHLMPLLAELYERGLESGVLMQPGNNIGYFGPYEHLWRGEGDPEVHWFGCTAGKDGMGIEADGTIKACPSLPTVSYATGNFRNGSLADQWQDSEKMSFTRKDRSSEMWGFCGSCYYSDVCQAGCTWTSHSLLGRRGNNPYCHYRALNLASEGKRERVVKKADAPDQPFAHGLFELVVEPIPALEQLVTLTHQVTPRSSRSPNTRTPSNSSVDADSVPSLQPCRSCRQYVREGEVDCPFCGKSVNYEKQKYAARLATATKAATKLSILLDD